MSGNGRGTMRPQGRSPPFLVIGLLVALCILGYSYWNVSSQSYEQASRVARLQDEVRMLSTRNLEGNKRAELSSNKLAELEKQVSSLTHSLNEKTSEVIKKEEEVQSSLTELENKNTKLSQCEEDKRKLEDKVTKFEESTATLQQQLKDRPEQCDEKSCQEPVKNVLDVIVKRLGSQAVVQALQAEGIDPSKYLSAETIARADQKPDVAILQQGLQPGQQGLQPGQQGLQPGQGAQQGAQSLLMNALQGQQNVVNPQNPAGPVEPNKYVNQPQDIPAQRNNDLGPGQLNNLAQSNKAAEAQQTNKGENIPQDQSKLNNPEQPNKEGGELQNNAVEQNKINGDEEKQGQILPPNPDPREENNRNENGTTTTEVVITTDKGEVTTVEGNKEIDEKNETTQRTTQTDNEKREKMLTTKSINTPAGQQLKSLENKEETGDERLKFQPGDLRKEPGIEMEDDDAIDRMNDNMAMDDDKNDEDEAPLQTHKL